jgi:hypothetical protein
MIDSKDKLVAYSREHSSQLNVLSQKKEFPALIALFRIEENNIKEMIAKNIPVDKEFSDDVKQKLAVYRGRIEELRILISIFAKVKKRGKDEPTG